MGKNLFYLLLLCVSASSLADVQKVKAKIKPLDLNFSCDASKVKTVDECYYLGVEQINKMGCHLKGAVGSANCDASEELVKTAAGTRHVKTEWACSVPSENCKENLDELCPLKYREVSLRNKDILGNGKVFLHFISYCLLDPVGGRKDPTLILQNATPVPH
jgi:hypothetical protein